MNRQSIKRLPRRGRKEALRAMAERYAKRRNAIEQVAGSEWPLTVGFEAGYRAAMAEVRAVLAKRFDKEGVYLPLFRRFRKLVDWMKPLR